MTVQTWEVLRFSFQGVEARYYRVSLRQLIDFLARYKLGDPPLTTLMIHPVQFWGLS